MFDPQRLLGQMFGGGLGDAFGGSRGRRKRNSVFSGAGLGGKAQMGLGLLGISMAAWEHYGPHLIRTMIAAANADGHIDAAERDSMDTEAERNWLDALARGLGLAPAVRAQLDARIAAARS